MENNKEKEFWEYVAIDLEEQTHLGKPETWNKSIIESFLGEFLDEIKIKCRKHETGYLAELCGLTRVNGEFHYDQIDLSYDTFRRIFITKESLGNNTTKNLFSSRRR